MSGVVERLHALLVHAVVSRRGEDPATAPVTVAEIYQELVPYRSVRDDLALDMNADYEHALLRLLSGESGLARLEPVTARNQLRDELASPNPNVTLFRKFAGCDVWLEPPVVTLDALATGADEGESELALEDAAAGDDDPLSWPVEAVVPGHREPGGAPAGPGPAAEPPARPAPAPVAAPVAAADAAVDADRCAFCDSALPHVRTLRYCPYCGADQTLRPCRACGEPIEVDWAFCVACGASADA
ncbi:MAG TPA: zinc ribbon domain-containing protein [Longimicrobiales bacterium]|nr:zinc ribbon domain-containing protein [Longimicrobiales bacterium]